MEENNRSRDDSQSEIVPSASQQLSDSPIVKRAGDLAKYTVLLVVILATIYFLRKKLKELGITWSAVLDAMGNASTGSIVIAVLTTRANSIRLTGYDLITVRYLH